MNKGSTNLIKGILGIVFFYTFQLGFQLVFLDVLEQDNFIINNLLYLLMGLCLLIVMVLMNSDKLKRDYEDFNDNYKEYLGRGIKYWIVSIIIMIISNIIISYLTGGMASNEENNRLIIEHYPIYMVIYTCIMAPIVEELTFRGNFKYAFRSDKTFVIVTSIVFAAIHVFSSGLSYIIANPVELLYLIPYGAVSTALALSYVRTDNVYTSIVIHSLHNTLSTILIILAGGL